MLIGACNPICVPDLRLQVHRLDYTGLQSLTEITEDCRKERVVRSVVQSRWASVWVVGGGCGGCGGWLVWCWWVVGVGGTTVTVVERPRLPSI